MANSALTVAEVGAGIAGTTISAGAAWSIKVAVMAQPEVVSQFVHKGTRRLPS
jgi:hypothetical protein